MVTRILSKEDHNDNLTVARGSIVVVSNTDHSIQQHGRVANQNNECATFVLDHGDSTTTAAMQSDDSSGASRNSSSEGTRTQHDPPATAEYNNGAFRSIDEQSQEPVLRLVEQEDIEVSAEIFVDDCTSFEEIQNTSDVRSANAEEPEIIMGDPSIHCEAIPEDEVFVDGEIQAAEIEIEEEDLDTRARDLMPNVAEAIHQPNLHEVDLERSRLSVSALTTTLALDEDVKLPAFPLQGALGDRVSSGGDSGEDQQVIFDDRTISAMDVACADDNGDDDAGPLPSFKCQSQEHQRETTRMPPQLPTPSPLTTVQVSGSSNTTRTDSTPDEIPVAPAVLVLEENLSPEDRSPPQSTLTRSLEHTKTERNFWLTIIAITLFLNSILVGGIVVGGFCAAGKCISSSKSASPDIFIEVLVPTPAPSRRLAASFVPTLTPTYIGILESPVEIANLPGEDPAGTGTFEPPTANKDDGFPNDTGRVPEIMAPNVTPPEFGTTPEDAEGYVDDDVVGPSDPVQSTEGAKGIPIRLLILIGVLCEAIIVSALFCYYRRWRRRHMPGGGGGALPTPDSKKDTERVGSCASDTV